MYLSSAYLRTYLGDRSFYRHALSVMIPVTIQQLINTMFNVVDTVMVGSLGDLAISAVSVANKPGLIFNGFFFGMTGAGGLLLSQYYGAGDKEQCQSIFSLQMMLGLLIAFLYLLLLYLSPAGVMRVYVHDEATIALGVSYLKLVSFSYLPVAVSTACIFSMRALGQNKMPMMASLVAMCLNAFFNYLFIFGKLGFPAMGVAGAALGTLVSRFLEMCFYLWILLKRRAFFSLDPLAFLHIRKGVLKSFFRRAAPLTANELLWSAGLNIFFWTYARLDEPALPAITIAEQAMLIGMVLSAGMSSAVSVMIGKELGACNFEQAKKSCKKLFALVGMISLVCTLLGVVGAFLIPCIFPVDDALRSLSTKLTLIYSVFYPVNALYAFCFFCLRAGGDTKHAALLDSGYMWILPIPVCMLMAFFGQGKISLMLAVFMVQFLMNSKVVLALSIVRRGKWIRNITAEG